MRSSISRRRFLLQNAAGAAAPMVLATSTLGSEGKAPASERITLGIIGLGSRGYNLLDGFVKQSDVQIVAVCDVDKHHHRDREWGQGNAYGLLPGKKRVEEAYAKKSGQYKGVDTYADFRELIARKDIDAVVVATPDHWHALITLTALAAGKDVYCEKPVTHFFAEGKLIHQEVTKQNAIFQTGSQQRSDKLFRRAVELVRNGVLGKLTQVEVGLPPGYAEPMGDASVSHLPKQLDYDFWCGPAPRLPYMRARHHRWWRGHRAFGGGVLMDWIGHHNDIAHWAMDLDQSGPLTVEVDQWKMPETDVYDTPHQYSIRCTYPGGINGSISSQNRGGLTLKGTDGWVWVNRGKIESSEKEWTKESFDPGSKKVYRSDDHIRNFIDCIKSREPCIAPAETAHRSITPGHLGYVCAALGRKIKWDSESESILDDTEANATLNSLPYREPWSLA